MRDRSELDPRWGKKGLILPHSIGTIDSDYRGDLYVLMTWIGEGDSYVIQKQERIAQLVIAPIPEATFREVGIEELGVTKRGEGDSAPLVGSDLVLIVCAKHS